jgi:hypothetical protein
MLLSLLLVERLADTLAGHGAQKDGGALASQRESRERAEDPLDELDDENAKPSHVQASHDLSVYLRNSRTARVGFELHETRHDNRGTNESSKEHDKTCESWAAIGKKSPEQRLGLRERQTVERDDDSASETNKNALPYHRHLKTTGEVAF